MTDTTPEQLDRVLDAAVAAAGVLRDRPPAERAGWLRAGADALDAAADRLLPLAQEESRLPPPRLTGELKRTTFQLRLFAEEIEAGAYLHAVIDHADADWGMGPRPDLRRMLVPLGPVAVWAASNFPFAFSVAGGDTASALAAGCPVVLVAHPGHPRLSHATAEVLVAALEGAGAPAGVFALVEGQDTGRALITDARITAGAFTGSLRGGRALFDLASGRETPIPFYGELGSTNPAFVTGGAAAARAEEIAAGFAGSMTLGVGQFCTKPGLLFVPADSAIPGLVVERLRDVAGAPMLNDRIRSGYGSALRTLASHEVVELLEGTVDPDDDPTPTLLRTSAAEVVADPRPLTAEVFGPAALVVEYADDEELLAAARALDGQLTATVQADPDDQVVPALLDVLAERAGRVLWGGWPTGVSVTYAQQHGGPYPATTAVTTTSVGTAAIERFLRPVAYQDLPEALLPEPLQDANPWSVPQRVDGALPR
ncbi:aldehyde dehydrogenase (NADP(+)) [Amnibacterium kyonggiense]|uniref:NADP-dependent aldehyde dehydrogenase n=1 Tax=Amnibacterium kyonggiense TaxID=595671 RepID=A0A4R7FPM4_9MICO|nr:aldehyde dehydrogenase (NADP(+)) [Amnibacterium kyonggiense]TDS79705.1 NADP-dependent aldehyde dehydrogenase [Amnibacterium kyonggiense]